MIPAVAFASCYVYSPKGQGDVSRRSRQLRDRLKAGDPQWLLKYAWRIRQLALEENRFPGFFGEDVTLIPVPGSAPLYKSALWVPERICNELVSQGLGLRVWLGLERQHSVTKSATALPGARPGVKEHHDSLAVQSQLIATDRIVLVDDVITRGRTPLAAASRIQQAFPHAEVSAFAVLRTKGLIPDIDRILEPCVGMIKLKGDDADREP